jgi:hypothetical protein
MNSPISPRQEKVEQQLRVLPATDSEVLSFNNERDIASHEDGDVIVARAFIAGDKAELVFSKIQNYVRLGEEPIRIFQSKQDAWEEACFEACFELGLVNKVGNRSDRVIEKATELINSSKWWSAI